MGWVRANWKKTCVVIAGCLAALASLVAIIEFFNSNPVAASLEKQPPATAAQSSASIQFPLDEELARAFTRGPDDAPTARYIVVFANGRYGKPRISQLFEAPTGGYTERKLFDLEPRFRVLRRIGSSEDIALARTNTNAAGSIVDYSIDLAVFNSTTGALDVDSYDLSSCWGLTGPSQALAFKSLPNGYALKIETGCRYADLRNEVGESESLKSYGEDRSNQSVLVKIYSDCEESCLVACYSADEGEYDRMIELYGTMGAPPRCPSDLLKVA